MTLHLVIVIYDFLCAKCYVIHILLDRIKSNQIKHPPPFPCPFSYPHMHCAGLPPPPPPPLFFFPLPHPFQFLSNISYSASASPLYISPIFLHCKAASFSNKVPIQSGGFNGYLHLQIKLNILSPKYYFLNLTEMKTV